MGTQHAPHVFQPLLRFSDEIHAGLQILIDGYYLRTYGTLLAKLMHTVRLRARIVIANVCALDASFSEEFYGLKRVARTK